MRRLLALPLLVVLLTAATGCGGSGGDATSSAADAPGSGGVVRVSMKDIQFSPGQVAVKVGQTVRWVDDEAVPHNVTATQGATFRSRTFSKGGSFEFQPTKAGTIRYVCTIHPGMEGTLTVTGG